MMSDLSEITTDIDQVSVCRSYLLDEPENCKLHLDVHNNDISIISMNIRSINKNLDDFLVLLSRINFNFDILVFSECWLTDAYSPTRLDDYNPFFTTNYINQNAGLVVYIRNNIADVRVHEPNFSEANCLIIELGKDLCVIAFYRPPCFQNLGNFQMFLENVLLKYRSYPNTIIVGDINIDIRDNTNERQSAHDYLTLLATHGILPGHTFITREISKTCLDHCMLKTKNKATTLVLPGTITDHSPVIAQLIVRQKIKPDLYRTNIRVDYSEICKQLSKIEWNSILDLSD